MKENSMQLTQADITLERDEQQLVQELLPEQAHVLELGCGKAEKTRLIAQSSKVASILALEVDEIQHAKNLQADRPPNVRFAIGGAENIPAGDASADIVLMFKSLHHVPLENLDQALNEIRRVLKPGGFAYLSEPIFAGDYNDIMRLFHDEQLVREAAFAAVKRAVDKGWLQLVQQFFFTSRIRFRDFAQFDRGVLHASHTSHALSPALYEEVRAEFARHMTPEGAQFLVPMRVDLLRRSG
jgi:ubiquinone/menaquinone biosynthesis C-methylase UbiE